MSMIGLTELVIIALCVAALFVVGIAVVVFVLQSQNKDD